MLEVRPCLVTKLSVVAPSTLFSRSLPESTSLASQQILNEESMRDYADLKFSLLLYDAVLIFIGTSAASFQLEGMQLSHSWPVGLAVSCICYSCKSLLMDYQLQNRVLRTQELLIRCSEHLKAQYLVLRWQSVLLC